MDNCQIYMLLRLTLNLNLIKIHQVYNKAITVIRAKFPILNAKEFPSSNSNSISAFVDTKICLMSVQYTSCGFGLSVEATIKSAYSVSDFRFLKIKGAIVLWLPPSS